MSDVTQILSAIEQGDQKASVQFLPLVYEELHKLAASKIAQENPRAPHPPAYSYTILGRFT